MESHGNITQIERCTGITGKEFYNRYVKKGIPVVLADKPKWDAFNKFTPAFFKEKYGHLTKTVDGKTYTLSELIDLCMASTPEKKAPYPNIFDIKKIFPELLEDLTPRIKYGKQNRLFSRMLPGIFYRDSNQFPGELFFGGKGCFFPYAHVDHMRIHTQLTQIIGDKEFFLYPPDQTPFMYPDPENPRISTINSVLEPDYERFPLFKNATPLKTTLHPGESIFMPSGWWHATYVHNFNLSYALDHVNSENWDVFMEQVYIGTKRYNPKRAWAVKIYKYVFGKIFNLQELFMSH